MRLWSKLQRRREEVQRMYHSNFPLRLGYNYSCLHRLYAVVQHIAE